MENEEFGRLLKEYRDRLTALSDEIMSLNDSICSAVDEHDGEKSDIYWSCNTVKMDLKDLQNEVGRRIRRFDAGDLPDLPQSLVMAIECCERLQDTARLCREGRENERRDLNGQISSNLGYLAHHIDSFVEDEELPEELPEFPEFDALVEKIMGNGAETEELTEFICSKLDPIHDYLLKLKEDVFWEDRKE